MFVFLLTLILLNSCSKDNEILYKKEFNNIEKLHLSEILLNSAGTGPYYQGSVAERHIIKEAIIMNPDNADVWREYGVPYLKRGICNTSNIFYTKAANQDPEEWLGYKAYCWLYFYRDYKTALKEIEIFDALTPDFVDYPQSTSVNYMRGICHLKLNNYKKAIDYLEMHLKKETIEAGPEYVESMPYILLGISYQKNNQPLKAKEVFLKGIKYNHNTADIWYYHAINLHNMNEKNQAIKALLNAEHWFDVGNINIRSYVAEFYQIYQEDIDKTKLNFGL